MRLLVYEHVSGGGFADKVIPAGILTEGYAMLRSVISDFKKAGHVITTLLDSRLAAFNSPLEADKVVPVSSSADLQESLIRSLRESDAAYFVAPEADQTMQRLVKQAEALHVESLNCRVEAIEVAANKVKVYEKCKKAGIAFPETAVLGFDEGIQGIRRRVNDIGLPVVFKPTRGIGCLGLSVVRNEKEIEKAIDKVKQNFLDEVFLIQELVAGFAASVSLISTGDRAFPLTLNQQLIRLASPILDSEYYGGVVPFSHQLEGQAKEAAQQVVEAVEGLSGYVGVDMVLTSKGPLIMEINPRMTTSYVGLTKVATFNPAQAIINAVVRGWLPEKPDISGVAFFSKVKTELPSCESLMKTYQLSEVVSPPFPVADASSACALLACKESDLHMARSRLDDVTSTLNRTLSER